MHLKKRASSTLYYTRAKGNSSNQHTPHKTIQQTTRSNKGQKHDQAGRRSLWTRRATTGNQNNCKTRPPPTVHSTRTQQENWKRKSTNLWKRYKTSKRLPKRNVGDESRSPSNCTIMRTAQYTERKHSTQTRPLSASYFNIQIGKRTMGTSETTDIWVKQIRDQCPASHRIT